MAKKERKRLMVVSDSGQYPFQRGLVTATFLSRNLDIEEAMQASGRVKERLLGRSEVTTEELNALIQQVMEAFNVAHPEPSIDEVPRLRSKRGTLPFSKGILLRTLASTGLTYEQAYAFTLDVERWLVQKGADETDMPEFHDYVNAQLITRYGVPFARRYRLTEWVFRSRKPIIILIGGATGTGKSTLAMELAAQLRIRGVTGTDMIRETLRTVLSASVVPGLHHHSFRAMGSSGARVSDPKERALLGFHQQANQVGVGIRAVIRRALQEGKHMIVEGTHLVPPLEQYLPPGADCHMIGFMLSVHGKKAHKKRFPQRAKRARGRQAADYLEAFNAVRWIHNDLVALADEYQTPVFSNQDLGQTLKQVVNHVSENLPLEEMQESLEQGNPNRIQKTLFLILDGLSDEDNDLLDMRTPLAAARTPVLDQLAASGQLGLLNTQPETGQAANTDEGLIALLRPEVSQLHIGRGLFEALGQGIPMPPGAILFRGNLATIQEDGTLIDRRAGRIREGVPALLASLQRVDLSNGITGHIYPGHEHRVILVLSGANLSARVTNTDPGGSGRILRPETAQPKDAEESSFRTAKALNELLGFAQRHLNEHPVNATRVSQGLYAANCIITRGAASVNELPDLPELSFRGAMISGCSTALGVARAMRFTTITSASMTGNLDTKISAKFEKSAEALKTHDLVYVHLKGTDVAAHDRRPIEKCRFIEKIDGELGRFLETAGKIRVVLSADHGTSSKSGNHLPNPVPVLFSEWNGTTDIELDFNEQSSAQGQLGLLEPEELYDMVHDET